MDKIHSTNRRRYLRFRPDPELAEDLHKRALEATGFVDRHTDKTAFHPTITGLVVDKSHSGCSMVFLGEQEHLNLPVGHECLLKAGPLSPLHAVVRWNRVLDETLVKIGFEFLE